MWTSAPATFYTGWIHAEHVLGREMRGGGLGAHIKLIESKEMWKCLCDKNEENPKRLSDHRMCKETLVMIAEIHQEEVTAVFCS